MTAIAARLPIMDPPASDFPEGWSDRLPSVRGRLEHRVPLAGVTWFRVGGPAEVMFRPADAEDLSHFLAALDPAVPVTVLGVGSNLLVRDGGIRGVVVRLRGPLARIEVTESAIRAGGGALDLSVALAARDAGLAGLEFLSGIPGTIGGALRSNAGAYGGEIRDVLVETVAIDRRGRQQRASAEELRLAYRHCGAPADWIFTEATLRAEPGQVATIGARIVEIEAARKASQPVRARTGGSTFVNPPGQKAWELIDQAGCRGLARGGAQVSPQHANFLLNTGGATAADLEMLGQEVQARVFENSGVRLEWEIRRVGVPAGRSPGAGIEGLK